MTSLNLSKLSPSTGIFRLWEKHNPLIRNGRNVGIIESIGLMFKLNNRFDLVEKFGINLRITSLVVAAILIGFAVESVSILRLCLGAFAIVGFTVLWNHLLHEFRMKILREVRIHQKRFDSFGDFAIELASHLEIDTENLLSMREDEIVDDANEVLYELALDIRDHEDAKDEVAKNEDKAYFNTRYDFFVENGLVPVASYQDFFIYCRLRAGTAA